MNIAEGIWLQWGFWRGGGGGVLVGCSVDQGVLLLTGVEGCKGKDLCGGSEKGLSD